MSRIPSIAVVLGGGLVQAIIVQDWSGAIPLPRIAIVDYDTEGADDDEITRFSIGDDPAEAVCRIETPGVYESLRDALSPRALLAALGETDDDEKPSSALVLAREVRQSILDLDGRLDRLEQAPTGDDYNALYQLANGGLIDLLKTLGDPTDFGD
ncbi:hypothetical protein [Coralloluteibacterium thermophilus]|jgi:hypothetical protein|uniref:Uncharacterized protein n=1 Tax=Coralloluteibacterium thermophilum TaxID=2707049 RepID=A0ABV9NRE2_9GAMM